MFVILILVPAQLHHQPKHSVTITTNKPIDSTTTDKSLISHFSIINPKPNCPEGQRPLGNTCRTVE